MEAESISINIQNLKFIKDRSFKQIFKKIAKYTNIQ